MVKLQNIMFESFEPKPDDSFQTTMTALHNLWNLYMPLLILIGIFYLVFGLFYNKIKSDKYQINLVISFMSLVWVIAYLISSIKYIGIFIKNSENEFEIFKYIVYIISGLGFFAVLLAFTVPQYRIGKKIKQEEVK